MDRLKMRSYNYVGDCAAALLSVLVQGNNGETYNLADPESVLTIANWQSWSLKLPAGVWRSHYWGYYAEIPHFEPGIRYKENRESGLAPAFCVKEGVSHTLIIRRELFYDGR